MPIDSIRLTQHGLTGLRRQILEIAEAGLAAADGAAATRTTVSLHEDGVRICGRVHPLEPGQRLFVLGGGKASLPVAHALEEVLGERIDAGAVVLRRGERAELTHLEVLHSDHPIPSPDSVIAARRILELAGEAREGDLVITCFTGGRSALLSLPPESVGFQEKRALNELLLASGMPIAAINTVRKHVSRIKGGRLAARILPARIVSLTISDVAGDRLDVLADLTTPDSSSPDQALEILRQYELTDRVAPSILTHLQSDVAKSPHLGEAEITNLMLINGESVTEAMAARARTIGLDPVVVSTTLEAEATEIGRHISTLATEGAPGQRFPPGTVLLGCGGEATVNLGRCEFGQGGPNQEAALAAATVLDGHPVAALFIDTDGSDGGTRAAGAICDGATIARATDLGLDLLRALAAHASTEPLEALDDLIETGTTGTNVNDLYVAAIGDSSAFA